jgi:L-fuconolactonase
VAVLVDHCAFSDFSGGPGYPRAKELFALADAANVHLKLSAYVYHLGREAGADPGQMTEAIVVAFGAERVMWASDLSTQARPYEVLLSEAEEACAGLSPGQRSLVLGDSAAALWWPGP